MERLTKRELTERGMVVFNVCDYLECDRDCKRCPVQREVNLKLKDYEDAEEQGLLIRIPESDCSDGMPQRVEVAKVVHGEWIKINDGFYFDYKCKICGGLQEFETDYCPNCGAKMDGKKEGAV